MIKRDCKNLWRQYTGYLSCSVKGDKSGDWEQDCEGCKDYWKRKKKKTGRFKWW